jgi:hypothetical protein
MWAYNDLICPYLGVFNPIANISFIIDRVIVTGKFERGRTLQVIPASRVVEESKEASTDADAIEESIE